MLDLVSNEPISGALIAIDKGEISTQTDHLGHFQLEARSGDHRLYVEAAGYISEAGHNPAVRFQVVAGRTVDFVLYLKAIQGTIEGRVVDAISQDPIPGALAFIDEGFANTLTDEEGRYSLAQSTHEHHIYVKAVDYTSDREDGWIATAPVKPDRQMAFNHILRPTLQLVSFAFTQVPERLELLAGQEQSISCTVQNTGKREGGATVRLIIAGFIESENTEWIAPGAETEVTFYVS